MGGEPVRMGDSVRGVSGWRGSRHRKQARVYHGGREGHTERHGDGFLALRAVWGGILPQATGDQRVRLLIGFSLLRWV